MTQAGRKVTIADVARHVGVAKGTVSRVLNNYTDISEETRDRIMQAVDELGYRPSSLARNLKRGRVDTFGIVLPVHDGANADPFLAEFLDGVSRALGELDKDLLVATAPTTEATLAAYQRMVAAQKVDGFILTRTERDDPRVDYLLEQGIPFVTHGRTDRQSEHAWFDIDNEGAFLNATRHLIALGHSRIGYIGGPSRLNFAAQRKAGYKAGLAEAGITADTALIAETPVIDGAGERATQQLLALPEPPTALLCMTDELAIGAMNCIRKAGLKVGQDITVISYDGLPIGAHLDVPLTTFAQHTQEAGRKLAGMLGAILSGEPPETQQVLAQAELMQRQSDGPPARTSKELAELLHHTMFISPAL